MKSAILDDIATKMQKEKITDVSKISTWIRGVVKDEATSKSWAAFDETSQEYLHKCIKAIKNKAAVPHPEDISFEDEKEPEEQHYSSETERILKGIEEDRIEKKKAKATTKTTKKAAPVLIKKLEEDNETGFEEEKTPDKEGQVEGLGDKYGDFSFPEEFKCNVEHCNYSTNGLLEMMDNKTMIFPHVQRRNVMKKGIRQRLLEAFMRGVPIHAIFVCIDPKNDQTKWVIDGRQRLTTFKLFKEGKIKVRGRTFHQLPDDLKKRFQYRTVAVAEIKADPEFWPFIGEMVNSGTTPMKDIELRRMAYDGPLLWKLEEFSMEHKIWEDIFGKDEENFRGLAALLKAVAMHYTWKEFVKPVPKFLDNFCRDIKTNIENGTLDPEEIYLNLDRIMKGIQDFGKDVLKLKGKKSLNSGLIDAAIHVGLTAIERDPAIKNEQIGALIQMVHQKLLADLHAVDCLSHDTASRERVDYRMSLIENEIENCFNKV